MTLEELRAEANKLGYKLIKKPEYIPHVRCKCGAIGHVANRYLWQNSTFYYRVECSKCDNASDWNTSEKRVWADCKELNEV